MPEMSKFGVILILLAACGSNDTSKKDAAIDGTNLPDSRPIDASNPADAGVDAPPGTKPLTVKNYLDWCSVTVNGGTASTAAVQVVNVLPGMIPLTAAPASSAFALGPNMWHHTNGDTGSGDTGTVSGGKSAAVVTVNTTAKCVWVCCPFANGTGCESTTVPEQCP
ncbi:MAG: hypothetical protein JWO36_7354 [Myxococcales bacterium]|nr:hypothetical protein [Myxococcales bacterium]